MLGQPPGGETDFPLQHTRGQDVAWFYATGGPVAPLAVLGPGCGSPGGGRGDERARGGGADRVAAGALAVAAAVWLLPKPPVLRVRFRRPRCGPGTWGRAHWDDGRHRVDVVRAGATGRAVWVRIRRTLLRQAPTPESVDAGPAPDAGARGARMGG